MSDGLMNDVKDSYELLNEMTRLLDELNDETEMTNDDFESMIHYNFNDVMSTPLPRNNLH